MTEDTKTVLDLSDRDCALLLDALLMVSKKADTPPDLMIEFLMLRQKIADAVVSIPKGQE